MGYVNANAASVHRGRKSCLHDIEEDLLAFIFEHREQGLAVSIRMVTMKASQIDAKFRHKTARAKDNTIEDLGVQVEHIPGGCTELCQPIDVGFGKPLKSCVRNLWEDWMVAKGGETARFGPPSRETVAGCVVVTLQELSSDIIKRSWRHKPYSYFQNEMPNNGYNNNELENNEQENNGLETEAI